MAGAPDKDDPLTSSSNRIERVAIVGAGGQIGRHIAEALLKTGVHTVTAITRPNSNTEKFPAGIHIVRVDDYSNESNTDGGDRSSSKSTSLISALKGQQALIITLAVSASRSTMTTLIRAAAQAGVPYIFPNWFGHDSENDALCQDSLLAPMRDKICSEITQLGVSSYIMLVCNFWYEFSLAGGPDRFGFDFGKKKLVLFDGGNVAINTSTWPQCGRAIAALLSLKDIPEDGDHEDGKKTPTLSQFRNAPVYISSFRVSQLDMFASVKRVTGTTNADWSVTHESAQHRWREGRKAVVDDGDFGAFTKMLYRRMFIPGTGDGDYQSKHDLHNNALGLPEEDLDEWTAVAVGMAERGEVMHSHRG